MHLLWLVTMVVLIIATLSVTSWLSDLGQQVLGLSLTALWSDVQTLDSTCWYLAGVLAVLCQSVTSMIKPGSAGTVSWNSFLQLLQQLNSPGTVWGGVGGQCIASGIPEKQSQALWGLLPDLGHFYGLLGQSYHYSVHIQKEKESTPPIGRRTIEEFGSIFN